METHGSRPADLCSRKPWLTTPATQKDRLQMWLWEASWSAHLRRRRYPRPAHRASTCGYRHPASCSSQRDPLFIAVNSTTLRPGSTRGALSWFWRGSEPLDEANQHRIQNHPSAALEEETVTAVHRIAAGGSCSCDKRGTATTTRDRPAPIRGVHAELAVKFPNAAACKLCRGHA